MNIKQLIPTTISLLTNKSDQRAERKSLLVNVKSNLVPASQVKMDESDLLFLIPPYDDPLY